MAFDLMSLRSEKVENIRKPKKSSKVNRRKQSEVIRVRAAPILAVCSVDSADDNRD